MRTDTNSPSESSPVRESSSNAGTATAPAAAVALTLMLAVACWVGSVRQMTGMEIGVATRLGSFGFFLAMWVTMMAAMMLPGAAPAILEHARTDRRMRTVPLFLASYLVVWALVGVLVYAVYRPHSTLIAGVVVIAAGLYEVTPLKRRLRGRCREHFGSGFAYGLYCAASGLGLMLMFVALGVMSLGWMIVFTVLVTAQKLLPARTAVDVPLALAILGLGALVLTAPSSVPGLLPAM